MTAYWGHRRDPTTLSSVRPGPGNWVCFWCHTIARWAVSSTAMRAGMSITCITNRRDVIDSDGNSPPKARNASHVPSTGTDSSTE